MLFHSLFVCVYQYAMMDHFYKNKASILCRPIDEACKRAAELSSNQLADVRSCDSFQRYYFLQIELNIMIFSTVHAYDTEHSLRVQQFTED